MNDKIENIILDTIIKWNCITKNKCYENYHIIIKDNKIMAQGVKVKTSKPKAPAWALAIEERINDRIDNLDKRVNTKIDNLDKRLNTRIDVLEERIDNVDKQLNAKIDDLERRINKKIDNLDKQINNKVDLIVKVNNLLTQ